MTKRIFTPKDLADNMIQWGLSDGMTLAEAHGSALNKVKGFLSHLEGKPGHHFYRQVQGILESDGVNRQTRRGQTDELKNARGA